LKNPCHFDEEPFDAIVSNPPYSTPWDGPKDPTLINDPRFSPAGVLAPSSKADLAFTMHMLSWLSTEGTAAIIEFPGVLYRGGDEKKIRQYLISHNFVDTVIQLPANLFFGVGIATCIIVLKKSAKRDSSVLFIDASKLFQKNGNKNILLPEHQDKIMELFAARRDEQYLAKLVKNDDILENDCNLSVSSYVEQEDTREVIDIAAVNAELAKLVAEGQELNEKIEGIIKELGE
jgi:type I restriction enzyme M protein